MKVGQIFRINTDITLPARLNGCLSRQDDPGVLFGRGMNAIRQTLTNLVTDISLVMRSFI
jgi:hypothetical protein